MDRARAPRMPGHVPKPNSSYTQLADKDRYISTDEKHKIKFLNEKCTEVLVTYLHPEARYIELVTNFGSPYTFNGAELAIVALNKITTIPHNQKIKYLGLIKERMSNKNDFDLLISGTHGIYR